LENNLQNTQLRPAPSEKNMVQCLMRLMNAGLKAPAHANPREMAKEWCRALVGVTDHQLNVCITHIIQNNRWWPMPVEILEAYDELGFVYEARRKESEQMKDYAREMAGACVDTEEIPF